MSQPNVLDLEVTLQTLNYATRLLASELDTARLMDRALDTLADFGRATRVALLRVLEDDQAVEVAGELSRTGLVDPDRRIPLAASPLGLVVDSRQFETFGIAPGESLPLPVSGDGLPGRECLCLPLLGSHNHVIAVATLDRPCDDPLSEFDLQVLRIVGTLTGAAMENSRLFRLATVDGLTGLYVRRYFEIRLAEELARVRRLGGQLALLMTDIDHFKKFNDTYGHQVGDQVLRHMADLLTDSIRRGIDIPCRYGGEEYVTILPATDLPGAIEVAERVRRTCEAGNFGDAARPLRVTLSAGVVSLDAEHLVDEAEFVRRADMALYEAKGSGRNRVSAWTGA